MKKYGMVVVEMFLGAGIVYAVFFDAISAIPTDMRIVNLLLVRRKQCALVTNVKGKRGISAN